MRKRKRVRNTGPMSEETKALLTENKRQKKAEEDERRAKLMAEQARNGRPSWRHVRLRRYAERVLAMHGRRRLEFMEAHPVGELFR